jgi:biotin carboxylase
MHYVRRDAERCGVPARVDAIARRHPIDGLAALDDFDVETAAMLREHLQMPGIGATTASRFRDKLAMRVGARTPASRADFTGVQRQAVTDWAARVPPPWVLKPRSFAAAIGIKKIAIVDDSGARSRPPATATECVPRALRARRRVSRRLDRLERGGRVLGRVQVRTAADGDRAPGRIFVTKRCPTSPTRRARCSTPTPAAGGVRLGRGVSHTEFIRDERGVRLQPDQHQFLFLETSARVGGAFIADTIEAATGINLWREWARIEIAGADGDYSVPAVRGTARRSCSRSPARPSRTCRPSPIPKSCSASRNHITPA